MAYDAAGEAVALGRGTRQPDISQRYPWYLMIGQWGGERKGKKGQIGEFVCVLARQQRHLFFLLGSHSHTTRGTAIQSTQDFFFLLFHLEWLLYARDM